MKTETETRPEKILPGRHCLPPAGFDNNKDNGSENQLPGMARLSSNRPTAHRACKQTILLIDDETMIIEVGTRMLEKLGYDVLTAGSGKAALELFSEAREKIALVILDLIMPDITGTTVLKKLRKIDPAVKVLLSSGYNLDDKSRSLIEKGRCDFIQKPFNLASLKNKIDAIIDHP